MTKRFKKLTTKLTSSRRNRKTGKGVKSLRPRLLKVQLFVNAINSIHLLFICIATEQELKEIRAIGGEYQEHLKALEEGREFQPKLTVRRIQAVQKSPFRGKRKRSGHGNKKMSKRHKSNSTESDSFMNNSDQDELDSFMSESDVDESDDTEDDIDESSDSLNSGSLNESDSDSDSGSEAEETGDEVMEIEKVTKESLKAKIEGTQTLLKAARERLTMEVRSATLAFFLIPHL